MNRYFKIISLLLALACPALAGDWIITNTVTGGNYAYGIVDAAGDYKGSAGVLVGGDYSVWQTGGGIYDQYGYPQGTNGIYADLTYYNHGILTTNGTYHDDGILAYNGGAYTWSGFGIYLGGTVAAQGLVYSGLLWDYGIWDGTNAHLAGGIQDINGKFYSGGLIDPTDGISKTGIWDGTTWYDKGVFSSRATDISLPVGYSAHGIVDKLGFGLGTGILHNAGTYEDNGILESVVHSGGIYHNKGALVGIQYAENGIVLDEVIESYGVMDVAQNFYFDGILHDAGSYSANGIFDGSTYAAGGLIDPTDGGSKLGIWDGSSYSSAGIWDDVGLVCRSAGIYDGGAYFANGIYDGAYSRYAAGIWDGTTYYADGIFDPDGTRYANGIFDGETRYAEGILDDGIFYWEGIYSDNLLYGYTPSPGIYTGDGPNGTWQWHGGGIYDGATWYEHGIYDDIVWYANGIFDGTTWYESGMMAVDGEYYLAGYYSAGVMGGDGTRICDWQGNGIYDDFGNHWSTGGWDGGTQYDALGYFVAVYGSGIVDVNGNYNVGGLYDGFNYYTRGIMDAGGSLLESGMLDIEGTYAQGGLIDPMDGVSKNGIWDGTTFHESGGWDGYNLYDAIGYFVATYGYGIVDLWGNYAQGGLIDPADGDTKNGIWSTGEYYNSGTMLTYWFSQTGIIFEQAAGVYNYAEKGIYDGTVDEDTSGLPAFGILDINGTYYDITNALDSISGGAVNATNIGTYAGTDNLTAPVLKKGVTVGTVVGELELTPKPGFGGGAFSQ